MKHLIQPCKLPSHLVFIFLALGYFALSPQARADCQQGCLIGENTVLGDDALINLKTGNDNTAVGMNALQANEHGDSNTGLGHHALLVNTTGSWNTAIGAEALANNLSGGTNTAVGNSALLANTTGGLNTAVGNNALLQNYTGSLNTATGDAALFANIDGTDNAAYGYAALASNPAGANNTALGALALNRMTQGDDNTSLGYGSLINCIIGSNITAIGASAGTKIRRGDNDICIGNRGVDLESNTIRIGNKTHTNTFIAGISGATVADGVTVVVGADGHLGTMTSSERYKDQIKPMDKASETILSLKPVTFRYKHELAPDGIPQFGLVAEQVEKINPDLVARDDEGKPYTVRYEAVNAMLLNEFLKEHRKVQELEATVAQLKSAEARQTDLETTVANLQRAFRQQAIQLQKMIDQFALSKLTPQLVADSQ